MNSDRRSSRRGFTLMEVLIVLAILVMLVGMVAPRFLGAQKQGEIRAAKTQIGLLQSSLEHYASDVKTYPTTEQGLGALISKPSDLEETITYRDGGYLSGDMPKDPWGQDYHYEYPPTHGTGDRPDIWSNGPDRVEGTDDDVTSWVKTEGEAGTTEK